MLNFAEYARPEILRGSSMAPIAFAEHCQKMSLSKRADMLNEWSHLTGLRATVAAGQVQITVHDPSAWRRHAKSSGLTAEDADYMALHLTGYVSDMPEVGQLLSICRNAVGCREILDQTPVVLGAEPMLNAGACPAPKSGNIIMLNQGLLLGIAWVAGLNRFFWPGEYHLSRQDHLNLVRHLPHVASLMMADESIVASHPTMVHSLMFFGKLLGAKRAVSEDEAFPALFVLLHELGHVALRHTDEIRVGPVSNERRKLFELNADGYAVERITGIIGDQNRVLKGLMFFFALLCWDEAARGESGPSTRTHPPARLRFSNAAACATSGKTAAAWGPIFENLMALLRKTRFVVPG